MDIGIQFQKEDERVWDNIPVAVGSGSGSGSGGAGGGIEPIKEQKAQFWKVLGDVVTLIAISSDRGQPAREHWPIRESMSKELRVNDMLKYTF